MRQILLTRATRVFLFLLLASALPQLRAADPPRVLASIQPIHSLTAMVMEGVAEPELFWTASQSPHEESLRPSDVRKLNQADLVIWVGPDLEMAMEKSIETLPADHVLTLETVEDLWRLPVRVDPAWGMHSHGHDAHGHHHHHQYDASVDAHLWLSPRNARVIVEAIRDRLLVIDPSRAAIYRENTEHALARIQAVETVLHKQLAAVRAVPYLVFHDAYQYFELSFALNAVGAVQLSPERTAGARHLHALHEQIHAKQVQCLFSEPQFEPTQVKALAARGEVRLGVLDPLGVGLSPGAEAWPALMQNLGNALVECLGADAPGR
jgi:zinc transport system substrate-binding protein